MSKEKKIYFSLLISLLFVLMVCIGVGTSLFKETQQAHAAGSSRYVWVGGVEITADNEANITGTGISGSVSYDNTTKTLYLTNAKITETFYYYAVAENAAILSTNNYSGKMTIALSGTNTIDLSAKTGMTKLAGITRHYGDVVISGNSTADSLNIIMPECAGNNYAIDMEANGLTVSNCTLNASGGNSSNGGRCAGIYISMASYYTLSIQNAVVSATGGSSTNTGNHAITQATVSSSTVTAYSDGGVAFKTAPILSTAHIVKAGTSAGTAAVVKSPVDTTYTTNAYVNLKAAQTYNISYYDQGATSGIAYTGSTCQPSYIVSVGYDLPTPTRANYTFGGWFTTYNGTTAASNISSTDTGNKVFYAKWTPVSWNVSYNDDGATTASSGGGNKYTVADTSFTLPTTAPTKFGYVFTGWKVTSGANGGTGFVTNDVITTASRTLSNSYGNVTLTAQWQRETTTLLGAKFYEPQVWDCQRSPAYPIANKTMRISGLKTAYDKNLTVVPWESGDYVQFSIVFDTVSQIADETIRERIITSLMSYTGCTRAEIEAAAVVSEALYDSTGTKKADLSDIGLVWALGNEGFLYTALNGAKATSGGVGTFVSFAGHKNGDTVVYKTDKKTPYTKDEINAKTDVIKEGDSNTPSDNTLYFGGTVVNTNGEVLSGITVNLTYNETQYSFTTDSKGIFLSESIVQVSGVTAYTVVLTDGTHGTVTYSKDFATENGFGNDNSEYSATDIYVYTYPAVGNNENGEYLTHTITIAVNGSDYGTVNHATVIVADGSLISADENVLMLGGATVTATANTASAEYTYAFSGWSTFTNPVSGAQTITATFTRTPRSYSITYYDQGAADETTYTGSACADSYTYDVGYTLPTPTRTGYRFDGWFTTYDGTTESNDISVTDTGEKTFYAKWTKIVATVEFDGETVDYFDIDSAWAAATAKDTTSTKKATITLLDDATSANKLKVESDCFVLDTNGHTLTLATSNANIVVLKKNFSDSSSLDVIGGGEISADFYYTIMSFSCAISITDVTIRNINGNALYKEGSYTATITNANLVGTGTGTGMGGFGALHNFGRVSTIKLINSTVTATAENGVSIYNNNGTVRLSGASCVLTGKVAFQGDNALIFANDGEATPTYYSGNVVTLIYDGSTPLTDGKIIVNGVDNAHKNLFSLDSVPTYAHFNYVATGENTYGNLVYVLDKYTVTIAVNNSDYGTVDKASVLSVPYGTVLSVENNVLTVNGTAVTATGATQTAQYTYSFDSWTNGTATITGATTVTANFVRAERTYTVTIAVNNGNYGTVNVTTITDVPYGTMIITAIDPKIINVNGTEVTAAPASATARYFYAFYKWDNLETTTGDKTITATFTRTPISYSITYNQDGGSGATNGSYTCESETITLPNASAMSKTGYNFVGWTESDAAFDADSNPYILTIPTDSTGNKIYYAKWIVKTVKITLDKNGGDADGKATATYGSSALTGFTTVSRVGYTLNGFYTTHDYNGIKVINANGAIVGGISELTDSSGNWIYVGESTFTLYAQWTVNTYTVTHDLSNITATANTVGVGKATYGTAYITKFTPTDGSLPSEILISVDGIQIEKGTDYSYNPANGNIEVFAAKVVGDIVITAKAVYKINYYSVEGSKVIPITIPSSSCTKEYVIGSNDFALDDGAMQEAKGDGYAVIGIYKDSACATLFDYTAMKGANDYSYLTDGTNIYIQYVRFHDGTGDGTKSSPYVIRTENQLIALLSGYTYVYGDYFKLGADITLSADLFDENGLKERQVLGLSNEFVGFMHFHIDGDNHTITTYGLIVSNVYDSECLMISLLPTDNAEGDGEISNLTVILMQNVTYYGNTLKTMCVAGVLAGVLSDGTTLFNVTINGNGKKLNINHSFDDSVLVGGLSGSLMADAVVNCLVKDIALSAVSESFVGGFVGVGRANILNGSVEGLSITIGADSIGGGFVGYAIQSNIVNSYIYDYSFLSQSNSAVVGGMAGLAAAGTAINNCYAYGENTYQNRAGIAFIDSASSVTNCHANVTGGGLFEGFTIADGVAIIDFKATNVALNTNRIANAGLIDIFGEDTSYTCNAWYLLSLTDDMMSQFARTYKVSYMSDGATGTLPDEKYLISGSSVTVVGNDDLEKDYYDFDGWKDGSGNEYVDDDTFILNADTVLTAQWKQIRKRVDFGYGGGTPDTLTSAYYWIKDGSLYDAIEGGNSIEVPIPTKIGYIFDGWEWFRTANWNMYDENGNFVTENSPTEDVEVQAQWYAISYTVTFASGTNFTITATKDGVDFASGSEITIEDTLVFTITPNAGYTAGTLTASGTLRTFADLTLSLVKEDITISGSATANTNTAYKVEHYFETLDGNFAIDDTKTQPLFGTTDTAASASALTVTGFNHDIDNVNKVESENIAGNGELVLKVYYKRTLHTVTWKNGETNVEIDYNVKYGAMPTFDGTTPTKASSNTTNYVFKEWSPTVVAVSENVTYTATWTETTRTYTITWDINGTISTEQYEYGVMPSYKNETPTKTATAQYSYTFKDWGETLVAVTGAKTYTAMFTSTVNHYTVIWQNGDAIIERDESVEYGATPSFDGTTPEKANTDEYVYEFIGWTPAVTAVSGNVTYVATFKEKPVKVTTPEIDPENPDDQDKIEGEADSEDGFELNTTLIVKVIAAETAETTLTAPEGKEFAKTYNATLYVNNVATEPSGEMTIKIAKAATLPQADSYTIIIVENGETVEKTATVVGDYISFTTSVLGDFAIIVDKAVEPSKDDDTFASLLWLIILLAIINAMEFVAIGILIRRNNNDKKNAQGNENKNKSVKMNSFVGLTPILAAVTFNPNEIVAVVILGASAVILAGVIVYLALKSYKAKQAQNAAIEEATDGTGDVYAISNTENTAAIADTEEDLKVVMAAAAVTAVVHVEINKKTIADYLENTYKDKVIVNRRENYTSTGLPLADTHYIAEENRKSCFVYVYELDGGKVFLLIKTDEKTVKTISKKHSNIHKSRFPKAKTQWYSLIIDDSFKDGKDLFDIVDIIVNTL
jgi:uncharacterized repeat protein (TIGR02543 family)